MSDRGKKWNQEDVRKGLILAGALCIVVLFYLLIGRIGAFFSALGKLLSAMSSVIAGCVIAFLLNPLVKLFSGWILKMIRFFLRKNKGAYERKKRKYKKIANVISIILSVLVLIALIAGLLWVLIPQLRDSFLQLYKNIPDYMTNIEKFFTKFLKNNPEMESVVSGYLDDIQTSLTDVVSQKVIPNMDTIIKRISDGIVGGVRFIINMVVGIIVAVYILGSRETLAAQGKKLIYATFSKKRGNKVMNALDYVNSVFGGFINGKIVDSLIIGLLCALFCNIVSMPYTVLISVIVGITNVIPFFGPVIGAVPSAFLVLVDDPKMCIVFVIFIIILQQIDGNIIGPMILGDSTGLSGLWVLFAILVGGNLFGFAGMVLGVPTFACIYTLATILLRDALKKRHLTNRTSYYIDLHGFDEAGNPIRGPKKKRESAKQRKKRMQQMNTLHHAEEMLEKMTHRSASLEKEHAEDGKSVKSEDREP